MQLISYILLLSFSVTLLTSITSTNSLHFKTLGINFGTLGDDLPSPSTSVHRIQRLRASAVKIYDANSTILTALSSTPLIASIMVPNQLISNIAANRSFSDFWIRSNVLPFYPRVKMRFLLVGNEVLSDAANSKTWFDLVPAMKNMHKSLKKYSIKKIKVGTTIAMDALSVSFPPSSGSFRPDISDTVMKPLLRFLNKSNSYYFVDAYPYFPWSQNPKQISLDYALFRGNSSLNYFDSASKLTYTNLLDQMLDSVIFAMKRAGFGSVKLCVAETGWPNEGDLDQIGANIYNAAIYNRNLVKRMRVKPPIGTPARPGVHMPMFLFALYNENQKGGPGTERHWGLLYPNGSRVYDVDLTGKKTEYSPLPLPMNNEPYKGKIWCVLKDGVANATRVGMAVSYACGQGNGTCDAIVKGGKCYEPNSLGSHASYAFNSYWQQFRKVGATCYFDGLAMQTTKNPSYGSCKYQSLTN